MSRRRSTSRRRASLLWGLVGALAFLVLTQGYRLVASPGLDPVVQVGVAVLVGVLAALLSYGFEGWLARNERV